LPKQYSEMARNIWWRGGGGQKIVLGRVILTNLALSTQDGRLKCFRGKSEIR